MPSESDTQRILDRIGALETKIESFMAGQHQMCLAAEQQRQRHEETLYDRQAGLCRRVQESESKVGMMWLGVVGFLGMLGKVLWDMIASYRPQP